MRARALRQVQEVIAGIQGAALDAKRAAPGGRNHRAKRKKALRMAAARRAQRKPRDAPSRPPLRPIQDTTSPVLTGRCWPRIKEGQTEARMVASAAAATALPACF